MKGQSYSCGLDAALDVIGGKWKVLILWQLYPQSRRFGELKRLVPGISEKMLIQQLREMETDGIVHRKVYLEVPPKVEYSLTVFGASLNEVLTPLCEWGDKHMKRIGALHRQCESINGGTEAEESIRNRRTKRVASATR
ncbi:MAG: winged helix-turn-helix transcriptional regulator [Candidatus Binatia bacterium]